MPDDRQPILELKELTYTVGGATILDHVDLAIYPREVFVVLGMSGSGKTTMLRLLTGLIRPTAGAVYIFGQDITAMDEERLNTLRARMGLVFQFGALFDSLRVRDNVGFRLYQHTNAKEEVVRPVIAEKLRLVGMTGYEDKYPAELSGGMQKRVGIARALVGDPEILFYDEPTSGLDPVIAATINELIVKLRNELGVTEVIVSHDIHSMLRMADRMSLLYEGRLRLVGTPAEFQASTDPVVRQFLEGKTDGPIQVV
jgi:phospholipid/cholesterol/gamma-HCH transport system ATP-binding protein